MRRATVRFAASAWGFSLRSNCFDLAFLDPFINAHYGMATESFCSDGIDPTSPDAGIAETCGEPTDGGDGGCATGSLARSRRADRPRYRTDHPSWRAKRSLC